MRSLPHNDRTQPPHVRLSDLYPGAITAGLVRTDGHGSDRQDVRGPHPRPELGCRREVHALRVRLAPRLLAEGPRSGARCELLTLRLSKQRFAAPPMFVSVGGKPRMLHRQCTRDYKVRPIRRWCQAHREQRQPVAMWLGISLDESQRMRDSDVGYITNRYPLIDRRMSRHDCIAWLAEHGHQTPPKSACIGCPFHSDSQWRAIRDNPTEWADAVEVDAAIRDLPLVKGDAFLHRSLKPLPMVSLSPEDDGQIGFGFENECAGVCGV